MSKTAAQNPFLSAKLSGWDEKMDMTERKKETLWVFIDSTNLPMIGLFEDCKMEISKNGANEFPVITLDSAGIKIKMSKWRTDATACVTKYGKDSEAWKGKLFSVNTDGRKLILKPAEENI